MSTFPFSGASGAAAQAKTPFHEHSTAATSGISPATDNTPQATEKLPLLFDAVRRPMRSAGLN